MRPLLGRDVIRPAPGFGVETGPNRRGARLLSLGFPEKTRGIRMDVFRRLPDSAC